MKKIISTVLVILIANYSFSCYSSQIVSTEDGWVPSNEKIVSVIDKNGIEIRFYKNSGRYIPEERVISGITKMYGRGKTQQKGVIYGLKVSLDDVVWVKVIRFDGEKTIVRFILIPAAVVGIFLVLCTLRDCSLDIKPEFEGLEFEEEK